MAHVAVHMRARCQLPRISYMDHLNNLINVHVYKSDLIIILVLIPLKINDSLSFKKGFG